MRVSDQEKNIIDNREMKGKPFVNIGNIIQRSTSIVSGYTNRDPNYISKEKNTKQPSELLRIGKLRSSNQ